MRRIVLKSLAGLVCFALLVAACPAQSPTATVVTGTVVDPIGQPYSMGKGSISLVLPGNLSPVVPTFAGSPFQTVYPFFLDGFGHLPTFNLPPNAAISPSGTQWNFSVCAQGGSPCFQTAITISGSSQDVSAQLMAAAVPLNGSTYYASVFSVKAYGATGNGTTDDTAAIQHTINIAPSHSTILIPQGQYLVSSTLTVNDTQQLTIEGPGQLIWEGNSSSPMWMISNDQFFVMTGLHLEPVSASYPLLAFVENVTNTTPGVSSTNTYEHLEIEGNGNLQYPFEVLTGTLAGNNDVNDFSHIFANGYTAAGLLIQGGNSVSNRLQSSYFIGTSSSSDGVETETDSTNDAGALYVDDTQFVSNLIDFYLNGSTLVPVNIINFNSVDSAQFLKTFGPAGSSCPINIQGIHWDSTDLGSNPIMDVLCPGPITITNSSLGSKYGYSKADTIVWSYSPGGYPAVFNMKGSSILGTNATLTSIFTTDIPTTLIDSYWQTSDTVNGALALANLPDSGAEVYNVKAFGAVGNGTTNDTAAIQAAVNAVPSSGGVVYFPAGTYPISSAIASSSYFTSFEGAGKQTSTITAASSYTGDLITIEPSGHNNTRGFYVSHLGFVCTSYANQNGLHGVNWGLGHYISDDYFQGCRAGVWQQNTGSNYTEESYYTGNIFSNNVYGLDLDGSSESSYNSSGYEHIRFYCERNNASIAPETYGSCLYVNGTDLYHSDIEIRVNLPAVPAIAPIAVDNGYFHGNTVRLYGEGGDGQPAFQAGDATLIGNNNSVDEPSQFSSFISGASGYIPNNYTYGSWASSTAYSVGTIIRSSCTYGDFMIVQVAGTSGSSAPTWNCGNAMSGTTLWKTTTDNTVTWSDIGAIPGSNGGTNPFAVQLNSGDENNWILPQPNIAGGCNNGSLYLNQHGGSGSTLYVCVGGSWTDIK
jgi:hypothetical protein